MKIKLTILFICLSTTIFGQKNNQEKYLTSYGKVWGFLKYFHPEPGKQDWDKVLLNDFEKLNQCSSNEEFNTIILTLFDKCGDFKPKDRIIEDSLQFLQSFEWVESDLINHKNKEYINNLIANKPRFKSNYIDKKAAGQPNIKNENNYGEYKTNRAIQYLAITRYWNIINYFYAYRDIIPRDWNKVYEENIGNFISAKSYEDYYFAVRKLTTEIRDGHGFIRTKNDPLNNYKYAPFYCIKLADGYYVTMVFQDSLNSFDLKRSDKLVESDHKPMDEKVREIGNYISSSNDYYLSNSTHYLRITDKDSITITVERNGKLITNTYASVDSKTLISRYKSNSTTQKSPSKSPYAFIKDSITNKEYCYINMGRLKRKDIDRKFKRKLLSVDDVIIDSRNYPNWTLVKLNNLLLKGKRKFAKFLTMDFDYPSSYKWTKSQTIGRTRKQYNGNIYVLVDYYTMSQAEYTVMALQQHPNTIVIGGQTAGADGNIAEIPLPFGITSVFSGLGVFYLDYAPTQQIGINRDYKVIQDKTYLEGNDLIFEKALELIRNE